MLDEGPLPEDSCLLAVASHGRKREEAGCLMTLLKALIPFRRLHAHDLIISQRPYLQITSQWVLGLQHMNLGGGAVDTNIQSIAGP